MVYFCPNCFEEIDPRVDICPHCQYHIADWEHSDFDEKLVRALNHPDPFTRRRAAFLLGKRKTASAFAALQDAFESASDPYLKGEILRALFTINRKKTLGQFNQERLEKESIIVQMIFAGTITEAPNGSNDHNG